jgi:hypothetical protein
MPREPKTDLSRYRFSEVATDSEGRAYLKDREPFGYVDRPDNIPHIVQDGDTLEDLAKLYYWQLDDDADQLYWAVADFQPVPIINPMRRLIPGKLLVLPAPEFLSAEILGSPAEVLQ